MTSMATQVARRVEGGYAKGRLAPTFRMHGVYVNLVKQLGCDR